MRTKYGEVVAGVLPLLLAATAYDGIERIVVRYRIAKELLSGPPATEVIIEQLKGWVAREFEMTREMALKAIRSERRLHEIIFDQGNRGPF